MLTLSYSYKLPPGLRQQKPRPPGPLYPLVNIQLYKEGERPRFFEGLLDSGADGIFIPKDIADILDLPHLERTPTSGVLKTAHCFRTKVGFTLGTVKLKMVEFGVIDAVFPEDVSDIPILIGRNPLFRYFEITFTEYNPRPQIHLTQKKPLK